MNSSLQTQRIDLREMKYKIKGFGLLNEMRHRYKKTKISVDILQILDRIDKLLLKRVSMNIEILKLNELIFNILRKIREILKNRTKEDEKKEEYLNNIITLYEALLARDTIRSCEYINETLILVKAGKNIKLRPPFYFEEQTYNDLYDLFGEIFLKK